MPEDEGQGMTLLVSLFSIKDYEVPCPTSNVAMGLLAILDERYRRAALQNTGGLMRDGVTGIMVRDVSWVEMECAMTVTQFNIYAFAEIRILRYLLSGACEVFHNGCGVIRTLL
jgi:hypothetical protein